MAPAPLGRGLGSPREAGHLPPWSRFPTELALFPSHASGLQTRLKRSWLWNPQPGLPSRRAGPCSPGPLGPGDGRHEGPGRAGASGADGPRCHSRPTQRPPRVGLGSTHIGRWGRRSGGPPPRLGSRRPTIPALEEFPCGEEGRGRTSCPRALSGRARCARRAPGPRPVIPPRVLPALPPASSLPCILGAARPRADAQSHRPAAGRQRLLPEFSEGSPAFVLVAILVALTGLHPAARSGSSKTRVSDEAAWPETLQGPKLTRSESPGAS